jgi:integrase
MGSRYSMTLKRDAKSGAFRDRIRLPEDVRREYQALYGSAWEEKFRSAAGTPLDKARAEHAAWAAKVKGRIAALRDSKGDNGVDLTQRQADALAGDWYRWYVEQHQDNPGSPDGYDIVRYDLWRMAVEAGDPETDEADFDDPEVLSEAATLARASQFLTDHGIALSQAGRTRFLASLVREFLAATALLERRARGDWGPDQHLNQLASSLSLNGQPSEAAICRTSQTQRPSAVALFEAYIKDKPSLAVSTINGWRGVFTALDALPTQDAVKDQRGAQRWLDGLVGTGTPPRGHRTVRYTWLAAARAVFRWGVRHGKVEVNPFEGCVVEVPRKAETRETGKAFNDAEVSTILSAALKVEVPRQGLRPAHCAALRRWVPWLLAYTGARVRELTQLRAQDIEQRPCGPVLLITPEAGTVKTGKVRVVPIHPHLIEMGLMDYVEAVKVRLGPKGPLFYRPQPRPSRKHPAVRARERLAEWVRKLGVTDPDIQPNHGWRHTFRTRASRAGIEKRIRDEVCGHAPETVADTYEHPSVEDMAEAIKRFPRYTVAAPPDGGKR